jgi:hypothetical protein
MRTVLVLAASLLLASSARAEARFGDKGVVSPYGSVSFSYSATKLRYADGSADSLDQTVLRFSPGAFYFVADGLALGVGLSAGYNSASTTSPVIAASHGNDVGLAPVAGFNLWLSERASLFPQVGLSFDSAFISWGNGGDSSRRTSLDFTLAVPILLHPAPHFFIGLGPGLTSTLFSTASGQSPFNTADKTTTVGLFSTLGGWF